MGESSEEISSVELSVGIMFLDLGIVDKLLEYLGPIVFLVGLPFSIYLFARSENAAIEKTKISWPVFAAANHLDFIQSSPNHQGAYIKGNYRGYYLELFTYKGGRGKSSYVTTRLEMTALPSVISPPIFAVNHLGEPVIAVQGKEVVLHQVVDRLATLLSDTNLSGIISLSGYYNGVAYEQAGVIANTTPLSTLFERLSDILDYYQAVVNLGGEAISFLETISTQGQHVSLVSSLLRGIAEKTTKLLGDITSQVLCPRCLTYCSAHRIRLSSWQSATYYGCRLCGQSREFFYCPEGVIVVLDEASWSEEHSEQEGLLRVNWLARESLFDFDRVEIVRATDEDVERFAVQVGNDTDPVREPRYKQMTCTVRPGCCLSENTLKVLKYTFGEVMAYVPHL